MKAAETAANAAVANDATTAAAHAKKSKQTKARFIMEIDQKLHDQIGLAKR